MAWRRDIIHQLHYRNETQYNVFAGVFDDYNTLLHDKKTLSAQTFQLEQDLLNVRQRSLIDPSLTSRASLLSASPSAASSAAASPASSSSAATSSSSSPSISLSTDKTKSHSDDHSSTIPSMGLGYASHARVIGGLEEKVLALQTELTAAYRLKAENAQAMLRMKAQAESDEKEVIEMMETLAASKRSLEEKDALIAQQEEKNKHYTETVEVLRKELQSLRSENARVETNHQRVCEENEHLVQRLLGMKNIEANEMNTMNAMYDTLAKRHEKSLIAIRTGDAGRRSQSMGTMEGGSRAGLSGSRNHHYSKSSTASSSSSSSSSTLKFESKLNLSDHDSLMRDVAWNHFHRVQVTLPTRVKLAVKTHKGQATCARYNTAGNLLVSGGVDSMVRILDPRTGSLRAVLRGAKQSVMNVSFSRNDRYVLATGNDKVARVYSMEKPDPLHVFTGHTNKIYAASFTMDNAHVVTASHDRTIKKWDMNKGGVESSVNCKSACNYLSVSSNANLMATAHLDTKVRFWSVRTGEMMNEIAVHTQQATCAEFNKDGTMLVTASRDNTLKVIDLRMFKTISTLTGTKGYTYRNGVNWGRACFSPDSRYIVAGCNTGEVYIWDVMGTVKQYFSHQSRNRSGDSKESDNNTSNKNSSSGCNRGDNHRVNDTSNNNSSNSNSGSNNNNNNNINNDNNNNHYHNNSTSPPSPFSVSVDTVLKWPALATFCTGTQAASGGSGNGDVTCVSCVDWSNGGSQVMSSLNTGHLVLYESA